MADRAPAATVGAAPIHSASARPPVGAGRVLTLVYGFFSLAAGARSLVQLATQASQAPLAYGLSAGAAAIYLLGAVTIARIDRSGRGHRLVVVLCGIELAGVMAVGTSSMLAPEAFPDATVWSQFGAGYGYVPALLPILGLLWARRRRRAGQSVAAQPTS